MWLGLWTRQIASSLKGMKAKASKTVEISEYQHGRPVSRGLPRRTDAKHRSSAWLSRLPRPIRLLSGVVMNYILEAKVLLLATQELREEKGTRPESTPPCGRHSPGPFAIASVWSNVRWSRTTAKPILRIIQDVFRVAGTTRKVR